MSVGKTRVLFLVLEMDLGGLQRLVSLLIDKIDKKRFEPYIACLDRGGVFFEQATRASAGSYILGRKPGLFDRHLFFQLLNVVKQNKIDIIHSHNGCSSYAALTGRLAGVKGIIHTDHGRLVPDKKSAILEDRVSAMLMNRFIGVSAELSEYLMSTLRISGKKVRTVINGVDDQTFCPLKPEDRLARRAQLGIAPGDKVIGTVCRLDPIKNLDFMIACMPAIVRNVPGAKLVIAGDGPERASLIAKAESLGVSSSVRFLGLRRDTEKIMPALDIYACTSLSEGTSMTILEAMACGLPVVASAVGGNVRLIDRTSGVLFPLGDSEMFVDAVTSLLLNESASVELGHQGRRKVEAEFGLERMVRTYEELYAELM